MDGQVTAGTPVYAIPKNAVVAWLTKRPAELCQNRPAVTDVNGITSTPLELPELLPTLLLADDGIVKFMQDFSWKDAVTA